MADIFTGNGLSLSYNTDTGNRSPQGIGNVQINEVAEFPVLEIESEVNQYDTYNSTYNNKLLAEKSANPLDIVVNYLPDDSTHQFLDEAAENQDVFQLTIAYQEEGSQLTYAMVNGAITSTQLSGDKDSVVTKTYEFTPTDVVARSQAITALLPVYQGDYGVGSNTTDVPQYAPAIPTGNSFIKVPSTQAGNPAGADMMGMGLVDGSSVSSLAMTKSGTLSIYAKNATTAWTRIYTATQMDARYVSLTRTVNGKQLSTDIVLTPGDVGAVPVERTVNGHVLSDDVVLTSSDTGSVPDSRTINGHVLSDDVVLSKDDVGLGSVTDDAQLAIGNNLSDLTDIEEARNNLDVYSKGEVDTFSENYVQKTTTVNGKPLSSNIILDKGDLGLSSVTNDAQLKITSNLSDLANIAISRTNLGLGSLATQNANAVAITGGTAALSSLSLSTALPLTSGGTGATTVAAARTALGLGTAATTNIGTSGSTVPLLSTSNTWNGVQTFTSTIQGNVSGTASNVTGIVPISNGGTGSATKLEAQTALDVYSKAGTLSAIGIGQDPRHISDMANAEQYKGFARITGSTVGSPGTFGGAGFIAQFDGSPSYAGLFVQPDGNRVFAAGQATPTDLWQFHEVPTLDRSNNFSTVQSIYNSLVITRETWPAIDFLSTSFTPSTIGYKVRFEVNDALTPTIFWRQQNSNTGQVAIEFDRPSQGLVKVSYNGGLAPTGSSQAATGTDMNVVNQGWQAVGGTWSNGPLSGNIYGSLFTQATQGLNVGGTSAMGTTNQWYQQRFYDTSNRIYSRIQTNVAAWGAWAQITTSSVSDERAKNIGEQLDLNIALNNISQMDFVNFTFKSDEDQTPRRGVVSQQIMNIDPQYVKEVGDLYHLDETPMMLDGLAAIKALKIKNDELAAEIETLKVLVQSLLDNK